jgi:hypothetical protein
MDELGQIPERKEKGFASRHFGILGELWGFLRVRKKWWLLPILLMLVLVGGLIVFGQSSALSPFIYALF